MKTGKDGGKNRRELKAESREDRSSRLEGWEGRGATTRQCPRVPKHIPHPFPHPRKSG